MKADASKGPKKILVVLTSHGQLGDTGKPTGFYLAELTHALAVFDKAKLPVELVSTAGGEAPVDGVKLDDAINARYWEDNAFRSAIRQTKRLDDVKSKDYAAVYFAGGHGTMWDLPDNAAVQRVVREIYEAGGVVGAVCHGPAGLVNVKLSDGKYLVSGKQLSAFTDDEEREVKLDQVVPFLLATRLTERGAKHKAAPNWAKQVVIDGRLVTGQNPQSATGVGEGVRDLVLEAQKRAKEPKGPSLHA